MKSTVGGREAHRPKLGSALLVWDYVERQDHL